VRSVAALCASAARHAMSKGGWPELLSCVLEGSRSPTTAHRLVAMTLIASLLESDEVTEHLRPHFVLLKDLLAAALQDAQARASRTKPLQPRRPAPLTAARVRPPVGRRPRRAQGAVGVDALPRHGAGSALPPADTGPSGTSVTRPRRVPQDAASLLRPLVPLVLGLGARALGESDSLGDDETITLVCSLMDDLLEQAASTPPAHPPTPPPRAATHLARSPPHPALYPPAPAALTPSHPDAPPYRTAPSSRPR